MRKSIFDIVKNNTDQASDVIRLESMFLREGFLRVNGDTVYTLKDYVEDYCFGTWKYRGHCLDVDDFLKTVNYNDLRRSAIFNLEDLFTLIELILQIEQEKPCGHGGQIQKLDIRKRQLKKLRLFWGNQE